MIQQFTPGLNRLPGQQGAEIPQPPRNEVPNLRHVSIDRAGPASKKLVGNLAEHLFPLMDRCHEKRRRPRFRRSLGQPLQFPFELLPALTHLRHLIREIGKRALQMGSELVQDIVDGLGLQNLVLQLVQQFLFDPVAPDQHRIGACAAIEVLRASILRIVPVRTVSSDDDQIPAAFAALQDAAQ
ncbi:MAG: hypothetical protein ABSE99_02145 [Terracidiphilus sp.]